VRYRRLQAAEVAEVAAFPSFAVGMLVVASFVVAAFDSASCVADGRSSFAWLGCQPCASFVASRSWERL